MLCRCIDGKNVLLITEHASAAKHAKSTPGILEAVSESEASDTDRLGAEDWQSALPRELEEHRIVE